MSNHDFDLVVIGSGPAASTVASKARQEGRQVALVEAREFGGTCALRGCNPKKVYTNAGALLAQIRGAQGKLVSTDNARIDWKQLLAFKREFTQPVLDKSETSFQEDGIKTFQATARFVGPSELSVGDQKITARRFLVATGARPASLDIPGEEHLILSDEFLEQEQMPRRVVFVGGGYVSMEFAHVVTQFGSTVTVLERHDRILKQFDPELTDRLTEWSKEQGMRLQTNAQVKQVERHQGAFRVTYEMGGDTHTLEADLVVHGAGRTPNLEPLDLDAAKVESNKQGIEVDSFFRSSNPQIFAAGDCAASGQPKLTPTANEEARIVAKNLFADENDLQTPNYGSIPQVAFTTPPIASVGLSESEARKTEHNIDVRNEDMSSWGSVRKSGLTCAASKIIVDKSSGQLLGAHLLGPGADETINLFALAMKFDLTAKDLKSTLFAFPTFAADVRNMV